MAILLLSKLLLLAIGKKIREEKCAFHHFSHFIKKKFAMNVLDYRIQLHMPSMGKQ
jgi:hypothetical protein